MCHSHHHLFSGHERLMHALAFPLSFYSTCRRVLFARKYRIDVSTRGCSRSLKSLVCEVNVSKHCFLARYTTTTNKLDSLLSCRSASNVPEANIAELNFRGNLEKTKRYHQRM